MSLLQPPYIIALTALYITTVIHRNEVSLDIITVFFKSLNVDMVVIVECAQVLFRLYAVWDEYAESQVLEIMALL